MIGFWQSKRWPEGAFWSVSKAKDEFFATVLNACQLDTVPSNALDFPVDVPDS